MPTAGLYTRDHVGLWHLPQLCSEHKPLCKLKRIVEALEPIPFCSLPSFRGGSVRELNGEGRVGILTLVDLRFS